MNKRKIAIFTGTRAEYGLLYWIIKEIHESKDLELILMVGGTHLSHEYGMTIDQIRKDGFPISDKLEFILSSETPVGISKSMALALISSAESFERNTPDLLIVLGDRFEALAITQSAMIARVPIAHIHGGETTEGLIDEAIRHSITKMSHFHFTSTDEYRKRVIQLGENPANVFNYGAPGIDSIKKIKLLNKRELSKKIHFSLNTPYFMLTYHPVTLSNSGGEEELNHLLQALDSYPNFNLIVSYPNADTNSRGLIERLEAYKNTNPDRVYLSHSLGQLKYLSLLKHSELAIGNSSSGLIEAPSFKIPTINIGHRQSGRISGNTVISCDAKVKDIKKSIDKATSNSFKEKIKNSKNPYGDGKSSKKIVNFIKKVDLNNILMKRFFNLR
tara:strand:+ start:2064 stop:3227 length:1164 start_codon:yes stop_codon:yes gene_type:complete